MNLEMLGIYLFGVLIGSLVTNILMGRAGTLNIDSSDPEQDKYLIALDMDLSKLPKKKWIRLRVNPKANLTTKGRDNDGERSIL